MPLPLKHDLAAEAWNLGVLAQLIDDALMLDFSFGAWEDPSSSWARGGPIAGVG
jgi:hypothetical protein